ncbi:MAG: HAMP domain-containing histidine kinase, partial [Lachnospiraceae bacterium]|nr:HAMP domain-containing histidine kinase [Lachnospiraceae bacterium]
IRATKDERTKAELITNVSHDIKTPLTSIINYVDLIKRENVDNPKIKEYTEVLSAKSERLKVLISDLVEASKTDTGNIELEFTRINVNELSSQVLGEFSEKFEEKKLQVVTELPDESPTIYVDGRRMYRILENIFQNVYKYAMENTRVYFSVNVYEAVGKVKIDLKNISKDELNISPDELTERFVRGDKSRSTEGSGLGLSIAKNLTKLMGGDFDIAINGDLFQVSIEFEVQE